MLGAQALVLQGASRRHQQLVHLEGLLQVVEGPELHGLDGALYRGVGRHHDDLRALTLGGLGEVPDELEAGAPGHAVVHDQEVEAALEEPLRRLVGASRGDDLVPVVAQGPPQRLEQPLLVVHQQDRAAGKGLLGGAHASLPGAKPLGGGLGGSSMRTSVPSPDVLLTAMVPPNASTMLRAMANPRPVPLRLVVK